MNDQPKLVNIYDPESDQVGSIPEHQLKDAVAQGFKAATPDQVDHYFKEEKYGTTGEQIKTGLEGSASAATFGLSTGAERLLGVKPEDIQARREINPSAHMAGQGVGLVGTALLPGLGEANAAKVMTGGGQLAAKAVGLGTAESLAGKVAQGAVQAGVENAMFQTGDEISKMLSQDPHQSVESAITDVGLSGLIGGGVGAGIGGVSSLWKMGAGNKVAGLIDDFKRGSVDSSLEAASGVPAGDRSILEGLQSLKSNSKEIISAANEIGAPVLESQVSASKHIQDIDSMLMQSPTPTGVARRQLIQKGLDAADNAVKGTLEGGTGASGREVGNELKQGLTAKLESEYKPIADLYEIVKQSTDNIPVSDNAKRSIAANIGKLEGYKFKGSNMRQVADSLLENFEHINSVDDIKRFSTDLNNRFRMTAPHEVGQVVDKLRNLEEASITRAAESMAKETNDPAIKDQILSLISDRKNANAGYKALKEKMADLGAVIGKKRPKGPTDFINFIEDINPEALAKKLFTKGNSEFLEKFAKDFPEEMRLMVQHQKSLLLSEANKSGSFNGRGMLKDIFDEKKMTPEVRRLMFSPEEIKKLNAAKTYLDAIPGNINPSGTSKAEAYRRFFTNPAAATMETVRDFGLGKMMSHLVNKGDEAALYNSIFPAIAGDIAKSETNPTALKSAVNYGLSVMRGERNIAAGAAALFRGAREVLPSKAGEPTEKEREKLDKKISEYEKDPAKLLTMGGETGHYMPNHASAMSETAGRVLQYVSSVKPRPIKPSPLDEEIKPNREQEQEYAQVLNIAEKPLYILQKIKSGTLVSNDVMSLRAMYPGLHEKFSQAISNEIIEYTKDGAAVPYKVKQSLSLFMGQSLDSSLTPMAIQSAQMSFVKNQAPQMGQVGQPQKKDVNKLEKTPGRFQTAEQSSQARQIQGKS